jgi:hypothetical protein
MGVLVTMEWHGAFEIRLGGKRWQVQDGVESIEPEIVVGANGEPWCVGVFPSMVAV